MARALYNKLNNYNLGGLVDRYDEGGKKTGETSAQRGARKSAAEEAFDKDWKMGDPLSEGQLTLLTNNWSDADRNLFSEMYNAGLVDGRIFKSNFKSGRPLSASNFRERVLKDPQGDASVENLTLKHRKLFDKSLKDPNFRSALFSNQVKSNRVLNIDDDRAFNYEVPEVEEVIQDEKIVEDETPVVEEKVNVDEIPVKDPVKTPTVVKKDIVPQEVVVEKEEEEVVDEIPLLTLPDDSPRPMKYNVELQGDYFPGSAPIRGRGFEERDDTFDPENPGLRSKGGKLYRRGGLAMLAKRGMKYNQGGRSSSGRMTNQELGRLLSKYNVR